MNLNILFVLHIFENADFNIVFLNDWSILFLNIFIIVGKNSMYIPLSKLICCKSSLQVRYVIYYFISATKCTFIYFYHFVNMWYVLTYVTSIILKNFISQYTCVIRLQRHFFEYLHKIV